MIVQAQHYGKKYWPTRGKYHWVAMPWATVCGLKVGNEWNLTPGVEDRRDIRDQGCLKCGIGETP